MSLKFRLSFIAGLISSVVFTLPTVVAAQSGLGTRPSAGIFGGVTIPRGDLSDEVDMGWHAGALAKIRAYRAIDARIDGTYAKFGKKSVESTSATVSTDGNVAFGTLGAVLNMGPDSAAYPGDNSVSPYLLVGIGMYRLDFKAVCSGICTTDDFEFASPKVENKLGVNIGFGATVPVAGIRTFAEGRYHRISTSDEIGGSRSMFLLSIGVKFR
jgi:hypothetical protein